MLNRGGEILVRLDRKTYNPVLRRDLSVTSVPWWGDGPSASIINAAGTTLIIMLGAANHDPTPVSRPRPLRRRLRRQAPSELRSGIHHCPGAPLAQLEGQVVFSRLQERFAH